MNNTRRRTIAFLVSGLIDFLVGCVLIFIRLGILPINLGRLGIPSSTIGVVGGILGISGLVVVIFQLTKLREPDE